MSLSNLCYLILILFWIVWSMSVVKILIVHGKKAIVVFLFACPSVADRTWPSFSASKRHELKLGYDLIPLLFLIATMFPRH